MFNKNSALVKVWIKWYDEKKTTAEQIPNLYNLREVIKEILVNRAIEGLDAGEITIDDVTTDLGVKEAVESIVAAR
ncbi:MAG TPA: hypothetical protein P5539_13900 [Mesotoga sp.]|nr:hypothetical protein [Mesotoga sp.]